MAVARFYYSELNVADNLIVLPAAIHHHAIRVRRLKQGELLRLFNGRGLEYEAVLEEVTKRHSSVKLGRVINCSCESTLNIELLQAISLGNRMDYALQKAVELGVSRIIPVVTERCHIKRPQDNAARRLAHWQGIVISACEQSGRNILPKLTDIMNLNEAVDKVKATCRFLLAPDAKTGFPPAKQSHNIALLIGPESGLTKRDIEQAKSANYQPVKLGPRILRTETATIATLATIQTLWGDF